MKLHVLGRGCGSPELGGVYSGYLVEAGDRRILLDCGVGVAHRLMSRWPLESIDAVVLSHLHHDHCLDVFALEQKLARRCYTEDTTRRLHRIPLFVPPGGRDAIAQTLAALGSNAHAIPEKPGAGPIYDELRDAIAEAGGRFFAVLPTTEYQYDQTFSVGDVSIEVRQASHPVPAGSFRLSHGGASMVYSGDTATYPGLVELARETGLLLCEATEPVGERPFRWYGGHMSAHEAGQVAAEAGVGRLVLTHFFDPSTVEPLVGEAARASRSTSPRGRASSRLACSGRQCRIAGATPGTGRPDE